MAENQSSSSEQVQAAVENRQDTVQAQFVPLQKRSQEEFDALSSEQKEQVANALAEMLLAVRKQKNLRKINMPGM